MKRILKRKVSVFGKEISLVMIALVAVLGVASAAVLPYIGNMISAVVTVDSPMELEISADGIDYETDSVADLEATLGGDSFDLWIKSIYNGEVGDEIYVDIVTEITNDNGDATCEDFESLVVIAPTDIDVSDTITIPAGTPLDLIGEGLCYDDDVTATITIPAKYGFNEDDLEQVYNATGTFALNVAPATYYINITAQPPPAP